MEARARVLIFSTFKQVDKYIDIVLRCKSLVMEIEFFFLSFSFSLSGIVLATRLHLRMFYWLENGVVRGRSRSFQYFSCFSFFFFSSPSSLLANLEIFFWKSHRVVL